MSMFSKGNFKQGSGDVTFIAAECQVNGTVTIQGNARIDGKLDGSIQATGDIAIGQSAVLNANIEAKTVSIAGEVHGDIQTSDALELSASARLFGDIYTRVFQVEQGAKFIGASHLYEEKSSPIITPFPEQHDSKTSPENENRHEKRKIKAAEG